MFKIDKYGVFEANHDLISELEARFVNQVGGGVYSVAGINAACGEYIDNGRDETNVACNIQYANNPDTNVGCYSYSLAAPPIPNYNYGCMNAVCPTP